MREATPLVGLLALAALAGATVLTTPAAEGPAPGETRTADRRVAADGDGAAPVLLELFTSQGCSSCPAADRLLSRLGDERPSGVIPLAFHVDYWNHIGWTDPFSSERWSKRQRDYARAFAAGRIYTPQLVVHGAVDCVGSQAACVERALAEARQRPPPLRLGLELAAAGPRRLAVQVRTEPLEGDAGRARGELLVALTESGLVTPVGRGENARRTLHNDHVVRRLERAPLPAPGEVAEVTLELDPAWDPHRLTVVAWAQDPRTLRVLGAASVAALPR